ncbi:BCD family MFS transporter [Sphingomonas baiyangensis]|uniref:BCD family MFS transporter n=1 Tax=Sphingomonas baiyangensis TaxID=2572576 RepID=A0A4U1L268_9SPHN|nr:BCD family MFS transporter [Sphingomonas baiyangensis]TKD50939.1 BCD family MFS transporter [Sphingomonas baiyangensis]
MSGGTAMWQRLGSRFLPFADAASPELPLARILRLSLFQVSVGMAAVLLTGTLNRVMIVELGMAASLVGAMVALPLVFAPLRALIGHRSDHHRSALGWRRVPYIWFGSLLQFGGLAILPFAMLVMSGGAQGPEWIGHAGGAIGFLMVGAGLHMTQTAGLALATDLAPEATRPRVVALLYVMLLGGMLVGAIVIGGLLADFTPTALVQVIQGAALLGLMLNIVALWKQEPRDRTRAVAARDAAAAPGFGTLFAKLLAQPRARRLYCAVALGAAAFAMQDVLLEPYGGAILGLSVAATTSLTALWAFGMLGGFALAARAMGSGADPIRLGGYGAVAGIGAFALVLFAAPLGQPLLLAAGAACIGFGAGLFSVGTLVEAMALAERDTAGLALGAWGAVQATAAGVAVATGAIARDLISAGAVDTRFGATLAHPGTGYGAVYTFEILLLFGTLVALGPLARGREMPSTRFGLGQFPT